MAYKFTPIGVLAEQYNQLSEAEKANIQSAGEKEYQRYLTAYGGSSGNVSDFDRNSALRGAQEFSQRMGEAIFTQRSDAMRLAERARETGTVTIGNANTLANLEASGAAARNALALPAGSAGEANRVNLGTHNTSIALNKAQPPTTASAVNPIGGVNMPVVSPYMGNISNAVAGASGVSSQIETQEKIAADRQKQVEANLKTLQTSTQPLLDRLLSKSPSQARTAAQQETGIDPANYFADQKQKIAEIETLTQEYNATKAAMEQQIAATGDKLASNNFINNQVAQIQRNAAPKLNMMSANINSKAATLEALQGNFNSAQDFVNQAVQDATAEFKYNMDVFSTFYEMNRDIISALDKPYQDAYESKLKMVESEYQRAVDEKNAVAELMMDNPNAGITITDTFASAAQKVARSGGSLNFRQEQRLSSGSGGGGSLGFGDVLQSAVNEGASPEEAARAAAAVSEQMGIPVNQAQINSWVSEARKLKPTVTSIQTQAPSAPVTARAAGQATTNFLQTNPYYRAFSPENLASGAKSVVSTVGNFFSGLFGN